MFINQLLKLFRSIFRSKTRLHPQTFKLAFKLVVSTSVKMGSRNEIIPRFQYII